MSDDEFCDDFDDEYEQSSSTKIILPSSSTSNQEENNEPINKLMSDVLLNDTIIRKGINISTNTNATSVITTTTTTTATTRKRKANVDFVIAGLMGQANMSYASGDYEAAISTCMEVIRNSPHFPEPFLTLATIYDEIGESEKSLQFNLVGAHLAKNINVWLQVSEKYFEANKIDIGLNCFEKACRCPESDDNLWKKFLELLQTHHEADKKKILDTQRHYIDSLQPHDGETYMRMTRIIFKGYHDLGSDDKALDVMVSAIAKHPTLIDSSDINLLLDFYISKNAFEETLAILIDQCGVELAIINEVEIVHVPENMPIDLVAKLCICLIRLKKIDVARIAIRIIKKHEASTIGDIYLEIAESLLHENFYEDAKPLFKELIEIESYNQAEVWLRYAECLTSLQKLEEAVDAYKHVIQLAPLHVDARIALSLVYKSLKKPDQAIEVLCQAEKLKLTDDSNVGESIIMKLGFNLANSTMKLVQSLCSVLSSHGRDDEFILVVYSLILSLTKNYIAAKSYLPLKRLKVSQSRLQYVIDYKDNNVIQFDPDFEARDKDLWPLYKELFHVLYKKKNYQLLNDVTIIISLLPQIAYRTALHEEIEFLICLTSLFNKNYSYAQYYLRLILTKFIHDEKVCINRIWNLFSILFNYEIRITYSRFYVRMALRHLMNIELCILNGHSALFTGSYRHALSEYFTCLKIQPANPLHHLMIGITLIHISNHKFEKSKTHLITQAYAFFNQYLELRGECQEAFYNLGRAMQQYQFYPGAIFYYEKALECPPIKLPKCTCSKISITKNNAEYSEEKMEFDKDSVKDDINMSYAEQSCYKNNQNDFEESTFTNNVDVNSYCNIEPQMNTLNKCEFCAEYGSDLCASKREGILQYPSLDLTKEIAFNLYVLYTNCKSYEMANYIVQNI